MLWSLMSGEREWIAEDTKKLLQDTGTAHYLAISGMHIGFVALLVYGIARGLVIPLLWLQWWRLALWIPYICSCSAAIGYANHVGWPASAQRSVIFVLAASLAMVSGRSLHPWTILLFAAAYILDMEPAHLDTLGYQLSFVSVAGILFWTPRIIRLIPLDIHPLLHKMIVSAAISVGASLGTLP
ncbi:MAG: ComEC/Rec2 family competence protein, partial [Myxococcota bacterium]|nr:ComEC/Rec2 family competence protein [Myxococcota bacterium]